MVTCQLTLKRAEEIHFENRRISKFKGLVTLTLTLDRVIRHTVVHHSSTSTYISNFIGIGKTFLRTDGRTDGQTDGHSEPHIEIIRLTLRSRPKNGLTPNFMIGKNRVYADPLPLPICLQFLFGLLYKKRSVQVSYFNEPTPEKAKSTH